jgi:hypothetical protein
MSFHDCTPGFAYRAGDSLDAPLRMAPVAAQYTKSVDTSRLSVTAVLTYPTEDLAGDVVEPTGGDWVAHKACPWVGLEHHRWNHDRTDHGLLGQPGIGTEPVVVAWARESLSRPGAPHTVTMKSFDIDGETYTLPLGTSYFDPSDRLSMQVFALVGEDALPGVSLEFVPVQKSKRHEQSPLERRPAYDFTRWSAQSWVHCATPVNPGALTLKSAASADALVKALTDRRVGSEAMDPVIFKALSPYLSGRGTRTTVRVENKAMPDAMPDESIYDDADANPGADAGDDAGADAPVLNGVEAFYAKVQRLLESRDQFKQDMQSSDSPELRAKGEKLCAKLDAIAADFKDFADAHDAKLNGNGDDADPDADAEEGDADADEVAEGSDLESDAGADGDADAEKDDEDDDKSDFAKALARNADGTLANVRPAYHKALAKRVVRFTRAEVLAPRPAPVAPVVPKAVPKPAPKVEAPTEPEPAPEPGNGPEDIERLRLAMKKLDRAKRLYGN